MLGVIATLPVTGAGTTVMTLVGVPVGEAAAGLDNEGLDVEGEEEGSVATATAGAAKEREEEVEEVGRTRVNEKLLSVCG